MTEQAEAEPDAEQGAGLRKGVEVQRKSVAMQPVTSSNVAAVGYTPGPDGKPGNLYVRFKSGDTYVYADVPAEEFAALLAADSPGQYHARRIKGVYGFHKAEKEL